MVIFLENASLRKVHTFATEAHTRYFLEFSEVLELQSYIRKHKDLFKRVLVLGGGSNLLFTGDFPGLVLHPAIKGISVEREDEHHAWVRAGAGENWDDLVAFAVAAGWGGVENLSLIPGTVGAVPVQNIGAYGQEASQVISSVRGVDLVTAGIWELDAAECWFGYRSSIFKEELADRFLVTSVVFRLDKRPRLMLGYGELMELAAGGTPPDLKLVRATVMAARRRKLPDPEELGNAGSFFKNPVVSGEMAARMKGLWPAMPLFPAMEGYAKLSAGWLIEQCGWKGVRRGDAGVHDNHALVLVNHGNATGMEIFLLSEEIKASVSNRFGIDLEREVRVCSFSESV